MKEIKEDSYAPKDVLRLKVLAWTAIIALFTYFIYQKTILYTGKHRYTIGTINGKYRDSKTIGVYYDFYVNDQLLRHSCIDTNCKSLSDGSRFIVKFYPNHLDLSIILTDIKVPAGVKAPSDGWVEIPSFSDDKK